MLLRLRLQVRLSNLLVCICGSTHVPQATATSSAHKSKSNAGAIAGGVVGGVVFLGIVAGLVAFILRRRRLSGPTGPNASTYSYNSVTSPDSVMGYNDGKFNSTIPGSMGSGRIYVSLVEHQ